MEDLIERAGKTRTRCTSPQEGQYLGLPSVAPPIRHRHQTKQGALAMELMQILDIELQSRGQILDGDELRFFSHSLACLQFFLKPLSQAIPLAFHGFPSRH